MKNLTYSIIIPHKNTPKLLQRCLDSIPQRNDLEVIVIDDNSDPEIVDFDNFPGKDRQDTTIIFDKCGKGAGRARNIGLEHVNCKKVLFADADDYFNYCLNEILDEYKNDDTDIVFFNRLNVDSELYTYSNKRDWYGGHFKTYEENPIEGEKLFRYDYDVPYCKIIKKALVDEHGIHFEETTNQNDVRFSYMTGYYAKTIKVDKRAIYAVTYSPKSIMFTWNSEKIKTRVGVYSRRILFLKENMVYSMALNRLDVLMTKIKRQDPALFEDCLGIIEGNGLDTNYYRNIVEKKIHQEKKDKNRQKIKNLLKKILLPLKRII